MRIMKVDSIGKREILEINENDYVRDIKEKIEKKLGIKLVQFILMENFLKMRKKFLHIY